MGLCSCRAAFIGLPILILADAAGMSDVNRARVCAYADRMPELEELENGQDPSADGGMIQANRRFRGAAGSPPVWVENRVMLELVTQDMLPPYVRIANGPAQRELRAGHNT
jgi:hypothetical protein